MDNLPDEIIKLIYKNSNLRTIKSIRQVTTRFNNLSTEDIWECYARQYCWSKGGFTKLDNWYNSVRRFKSSKWVRLIISGTEGYMCRGLIEYEVNKKLGQIKVRPWWTLNMFVELSERLFLLDSFLWEIKVIKWKNFHIIADHNNVPHLNEFSVDRTWYSILSSSKFPMNIDYCLDNITNELGNCLYDEIHTIVLGTYIEEQNNLINNCYRIIK